MPHNLVHCSYLINICRSQASSSSTTLTGCTLAVEAWLVVVRVPGDAVGPVLAGLGRAGVEALSTVQSREGRQARARVVVDAVAACAAVEARHAGALVTINLAARTWDSSRAKKMVKIKNY